MVQDGLFELFPVDCVFGMHNRPGLEVGKFGIHVGPMQTAADIFEITITGDCSHAAHPYHDLDPIVPDSEIVLALPPLLLRTLNPMNPAVVSVTHTPPAHNPPQT